MRLGGGTPQYCIVAWVGWEILKGLLLQGALCILDKAQRHLFPGQEGRGPGSCHIATDHRGKGCVFHPYLQGILQNFGHTPLK